MRFAAALLLLAAAAQLSPATAQTRPLAVVAAENVYGDVAKQVGGEDVRVTSILANPDQDPHLFEISPSVARAVTTANIAIRNGLDYDPWMERLLAVARAPVRNVLVVADLAGRRPGGDPHVWYDAATMLALASALSHAYAAADPAHAEAYARRLEGFEASMAPVEAKIASLRRKLAGAQVTATEPVFGYMIAALGMISLNQGFQRAVMNGTEASATEVAAFEDDLRSHRVRLLVFNRQAENAVAARMRAIALAAGVPVLGAAETEPAGATYQTWMLAELEALDRVMGAQH